MPIFLDELPYHVEINGHTYNINCDFRTGMKMDIAFHDERLSDQERYIEMCKLFYDMNDMYVEDVEKAVYKMIWFYTCGNYDHEAKSTEDKEATKAQKRAREYCFKQDADLINGAFLQSYGIDLTSPQTKLHWWAFMSLFRSLPPDTEIRQYIYYRTCDIGKLPKAQQKAVRELRKKIRIKSEVPKEEKSKEARLQKHNRELLEHARYVAQSMRKTKNTD